LLPTSLIDLAIGAKLMKFYPDGAFALARSVVLDRLSRAELSDASRSILVGASVTESILPIICPCVSDTTISFTRAVGWLGGHDDAGSGGNLDPSRRIEELGWQHQ
jgi:hypothetical protein